MYNFVDRTVVHFFDLALIILDITKISSKNCLHFVIQLFLSLIALMISDSMKPMFPCPKMVKTLTVSDALYHNKRGDCTFNFLR